MRMTWPFTMVKSGVNPLAWKKCCHSAMTDSPTLHSYSLVLYLVLYGPGPWHAVLLYLVVCLHESWQEMKVLLLLWRWQPHTIPEALLVTLLSQVHPNTQQLCIDQHLDSDAAVLYNEAAASWLLLYSLLSTQLDIRWGRPHMAVGHTAVLHSHHSALSFEQPRCCNRTAADLSHNLAHQGELKTSSLNNNSWCLISSHRFLQVYWVSGQPAHRKCHVLMTQCHWISQGKNPS